jgi:chromosome segregation ATPase
VVILCGLLLARCAGVDTTPIEKDIARAEEAIKGARRSGADKHTPVQLNQAERKLEEARTSLRNEDYQEAGWLAEEALVCANVAEARTRAAKTRKTVRELETTIETLKDEIQPPGMKRH